MKITSSYLRFIYSGLNIFWLFFCSLTIISESSAQNNSVISLLNPGHRYGETEIEKKIFPNIENTIQILKEKKLILEDDSLQVYVNGILENLLPDELKPFDIKIYLVKDFQINAGMYANGIMVINTGLLASLTSEAQLAFIMAHELAHFIYRHSLLKYYQAEELLAKYNKRVFKSEKSAHEAKSKILEYSRFIETEADSLGLSIFLNADYNALHAVKSLESLPDPDYYELNFIGILNFIFEDDAFTPLPTHPKNEDRISFVNKSIQNQKAAGYVGESEQKKYAFEMAQLNMKILKSKGSTFELLQYLGEIQENFIDSTSMFFKEIELTKAEIYYQILEDPMISGATLYVLDKIEKKEPVNVGLLGANKIYKKRFEEKRPEIEQKAFSLLQPLLEEEYITYRAHKILGLLYLQKGENKKAEQYLNKYINSGKTIPDKRFIKYLLSEMKN